jgi:LysR family hydrogen peroxide-inducible transcriptional activator
MSGSPTVKQLRYLISLEKFKHFAKAAEACHVSQPAFSVAIKELESILGTRLVDRTNKSVTFTSKGKEVASHARLVIGDLEGLVEIAKSSKEILSGELRLGVIPTIAPFILPGLLPKLRKKYPDLKLFLYEDLTDRIYQRLMQGDVDVIILALPYELKNVETLSLYKDKFHLAARKDSAYFNSNSTGIDQLPDSSVILMEDGHCLRDHALAACKMRNAKRVSQITATSLLTLIQMVDSDLGVTYLPEISLGSHLLKNTKIQTYSLKPGNYREIGLAWRKGSHKTDDFNALAEFITSQHS